MTKHIRIVIVGDYGQKAVPYCVLSKTSRMRGASAPTTDCDKCLQLWFDDRSMYLCDHYKIGSRLKVSRKKREGVE